MGLLIAAAVVENLSADVAAPHISTPARAYIVAGLPGKFVASSLLDFDGLTVLHTFFSSISSTQLSVSELSCRSTGSQSGLADQRQEAPS